MNELISICITNKNRSKIISDDRIIYLLPDCINSIRDIIEDNNIELVISDWMSTDWPVADWIEQKAPDIPIHIIDIDCEDGFSAGYGRNTAAKKANGDLLFFIDADVLLNRASFSECLCVTKKKRVCFPKINYELLYNSHHYRLHTGAGNVLIRKELFEQAGKWPEYWSYGFEDIEFAENVKKITNELPTSQTPMIHQWHPGQYGWSIKEDKKIEPIKQKCVEENNKEVDILKQMAILNIKDPNTTHSKIKYSRSI